MVRIGIYLLVIVVSANVAFARDCETGPVFSGSPPLQLTEDVPYELYNTAWPDGSKILFSCERDATHVDIFTVPTDGSKVKTKISPGDENYECPDVNPAGTHICYSVGPDTDAKWEIAVLELGGSENVITNNVPSDLDSRYPVYNSDGSKIAYARLDSATNTDTLVTVNPDGTGEEVICTLSSGFYNSVQSLDWLGNNNELVYTTMGGGLHKVDATPGSTPTAVDMSEIYHVCASNSDGSKIAASCSDAPYQKYVSINPDGTGKTTIVDMPSFPMFQNIWCMLCWTADDSGIIVLATEDGSNKDIYLVTSFTGIKASSLGSLKTRFK